MTESRSGVLMLVVGFVAIAAVMALLFSHGDVAPEPTGMPGAVATSGYGDDIASTGEREALYERERIPHDPNAAVLEAIRRDVGNPQLIGRHVTLHIDGASTVENLAAFWVGGGDHRVLVVMNRDTRTGAQRQIGDPPTHGISPGQPGQEVTISGTVQRLPRAEDMESWRLSRADRAALRADGVYIQAHTITGQEGAEPHPAGT